MTAVTLEAANDALRSAVHARLAATPLDDPKMAGYVSPEPMPDVAKAGDLQHVHPTSRKFFDLCDSLKRMHAHKSRDYGCPTGTDPLANIRNGAAFVGIPAWRGAMVRLSDKVTRLATYNATGTLTNESVEDNLLDLASYALLALLLHQEDHGK
jgi:hypothetical protein